MKHPPFLRKALPVLVLIAIVMTLAVPTTALLSGEYEEAASVASFSKNGTADDVITFSARDFYVETGGDNRLDSILLASLPDANAGALMLGDTVLMAGDQISMSAVSGMRFRPLSLPTVGSTSFTFIPVFSSGLSGDEVTVLLYLLSAENYPPIAENLELNTYKNVEVTGFFSATDPEGDLLSFRVMDKPARGAVTIMEDGSSEFVYTPYENKTGKDSFTYVAVDSVGNTSEPASVSVKISKANTKVSYADMDGDGAHKSALRLAESGIFVGECMGGSYFFRPGETVTRGEFVAMAMDVVGVAKLEGITRTGFADDSSIPVWSKPYISSALKSGLVRGSVNDLGQVVFNANNAITRAEATVLLDRLLEISDVSTDVWYADSAAAPAWAYQSAVNLETVGIIRTDASGALSLNTSLTRGGAADMFSAALDVLEARQTSNWFSWRLN